MKRRIPITIAIVVVLIAMTRVFLFPPFTPVKPHPPLPTTVNNIRQISLGLMTYATDHANHMPRALSLLMPDYIDSDYIFYLNPDNPNLKNHIYYPNNEDSRIRLMDALSPYQYIQFPTLQLAIIHETPGLWKDNKMAWVFLEKNEKGLWRAGVIQRRTPQEFEASILSKLKTTPSKSQ